MLHENTPRIETERLYLRQFEQSDILSFFNIMSDEKANIFLPWFAVKNIDEAYEMFNEKYLRTYSEVSGYRYAICLKEDNVPIGYINVSNDDSHDFGYGLRAEFWHKGIVTEACNEVVSLLRKADFSYITATHDIHNSRSGEVLKKLGMQYKYSYVEQWQPKNLSVIFRMYQLNFDEKNDYTYIKYWNEYKNHFVEENFKHLKTEFHLRG